MKNSAIFLFCAIALTYPLSIEAQNAFVGDVSDKNYILKHNITDIIQTDSSASSKGKISKTRFSFDSYGRMSEKKVENDTQIISTRFVYDAKGHLITIRTTLGIDKPLSEEKFEYDPQNRLVKHETNDFVQKKSTTEQIEWIDELTRFTLRKTGDEEDRFLTVFTPDMRPLDMSYADGSGFMWLYADGLALIKKEKGEQPTLNIERYEYDTERRITLAEDIYSQKQYAYNLKGCLSNVEIRDSEGNKTGFQTFEYNYKVQ